MQPRKQTEWACAWKIRDTGRRSELRVPLFSDGTLVSQTNDSCLMAATIDISERERHDRDYSYERTRKNRLSAARVGMRCII